MPERTEGLKIKPISPFRKFDDLSLGQWTALDPESRLIRYTFDTVHPWVDTVIKNTLIGCHAPLTERLQRFCPLDEQQIIALAKDIYSDSQSREVIVSEWNSFWQDVQLIVNHMAGRVPTIAIEGPHGTGKTTVINALAQRLLKEGISVGVTKNNGFVSVDGETDESQFYTGLSVDTVLKEKLSRVDRKRQKPSYTWDINDKSPGEQSWEYLKEHWLKVIAGLYNDPQKIIISDRSFSRVQGWMKDKNSKPSNPFTTQLDMQFLSKYFRSNDPNNYFRGLAMSEIILPLPYTLYLDEDIHSVQARLAESGEVARIQQNERNHRSLRSIALEYKYIVSEHPGGEELVRFTGEESLEEKIAAAEAYAKHIIGLH